MNQNYSKIHEIIEKSSKINIYHHVTPDGDCYGSQYGLYHLIKDNFKDKEVNLISEDNLKFDYINYDPALQADNNDADLSIIVDTSSIKRVSGNGWKNSKEVIVIDHHDTVNDPITDVAPHAHMFVEPAWPSNSQFIYYIAKKLDWKRSNKAKEYIATGMITDTREGNIAYVVQNGGGPIAQEISEEVDLQEIRNKITNKPESHIKVMKWFYENAVVNKDYNYMVVEKKDLEELNATWDTFYREVNKLATLGNPKYWFSFTWVDEDRYKFSIRSYASTTRVDKLAEELGGGGHKWSAGAFCNREQMLNFIEGQKV